MGKHLCKQGLRRCWKCKKVLSLNTINFFKSNRKKDNYLGRKCKLCSKILSSIWKKNNKGKINEINRKWGKINRLKLRFQVLQRDNFTCQYCGRKSPNVELQIDHKYPRSKGGLDKIENYITACWECNIGKGDAILNEFNKW